MKNNIIIVLTITVLIIIAIIVIIVIILLSRKKKDSKNNLKYNRYNTNKFGVLNLEPSLIVPLQSQPVMFRAYADKDNIKYKDISYLRNSNPSILQWFQASKTVNVSYTTNVVCQGAMKDSTFGLIYFFIDLPLPTLPNIYTDTFVTGSGNIYINRIRYKRSFK